MFMIKQIFVVLIMVALILTGCGPKTTPPANSESADNKTSTETTTATAANDMVPVNSLILIESGKFNPAVLTVKKGTEVTWVNKDANPSWVASDPHPTHNGYPGFDAGKGMIQGETYKFKFDKVGTFGYHDHLDITSTGKIEVTP
jgi:plastocyanin